MFTNYSLQSGFFHEVLLIGGNFNNVCKVGKQIKIGLGK